jgi:hypothetical protein
LLFPVLIYVLIVRASIKAGYHPIGYGLLYGAVFGFASLLGPGGISSALVLGLVAALSCGFILWLLERFEGSPFLWWSAFVLGVPMPIWVQAIM